MRNYWIVAFWNTLLLFQASASRSDVVARMTTTAFAMKSAVARSGLTSRKLPVLGDWYRKQMLLISLLTEKRGIGKHAKRFASNLPWGCERRKSCNRRQCHPSDYDHLPGNSPGSLTYGQATIRTGPSSCDLAGTWKWHALAGMWHALWIWLKRTVYLKHPSLVRGKPESKLWFAWWVYLWGDS